LLGVDFVVSVVVGTFHTAGAGTDPLLVLLLATVTTAVEDLGLDNFVDGLVVGTVAGAVVVSTPVATGIAALLSTPTTTRAAGATDVVVIVVVGAMVGVVDAVATLGIVLASDGVAVVAPAALVLRFLARDTFAFLARAADDDSDLEGGRFRFIFCFAASFPLPPWTPNLVLEAVADEEPLLLLLCVPPPTPTVGFVLDAKIPADAEDAVSPNTTPTFTCRFRKAAI
jgi:hypothetical protein